MNNLPGGRLEGVEDWKCITTYIGDPKAQPDGSIRRNGFECLA